MKKIITALLVIACLFTAVSCKDEANPWEEVFNYDCFDPSASEKAAAAYEAFNLYYGPNFETVSEELTVLISDETTDTEGTLKIVYNTTTKKYDCTFTGSFDNETLAAPVEFTSTDLEEGSFSPFPAGTDADLEALLKDVIVNPNVDSSYPNSAVVDASCVTVKKLIDNPEELTSSLKTATATSSVYYFDEVEKNTAERLSDDFYLDYFNNVFEIDFTYGENNTKANVKWYYAQTFGLYYSIIELDGERFLMPN